MEEVTIIIIFHVGGVAKHVVMCDDFSSLREELKIQMNGTQGHVTINGVVYLKKSIDKIYMHVEV